ncbi:MAG: ABC-2 family transporter protein [Deltaproteobacteria bacterium]|nr:ABC-2 family transporter protein [Deltaproteobacteria bacterium]
MKPRWWRVLSAPARNFLAQLRLSFVSALQYRTDYLLTVFSVAVSAGVEIALWQLVLKKTGQVRGYGLADLIVYLIVANVISMMCVNWESVLDMSEEIRQGSVSRHLLKPISLFSVATGDWLARKIPVMLGALPVFAGLHHWIPLQFHPHFNHVLMFFALLATSLWLSAEIYFLIIMTAFWLSENQGVAIGFNVLRWGFAGTAFPLAFYPGLLVKFLDATPMPYFVYYPTLALLGRLPTEEFFLKFLYAVFIGCALSFNRWATWQAAERRLQTVGG